MKNIPTNNIPKCNYIFFFKGYIDKKEDYTAI